MNADIVPIKRLPDHLGVFTYRVPESDAPRAIRGAYVRIPFRGRNIWGIVVHSPAHVEFAHSRLRSILDIRTDYTLTEEEVRAIERAAALYRTAIATVALHALPMPLQRTGIAPRVVKQEAPHRRAAHEKKVNPLLRGGMTVAVWSEHHQRDAALQSLARTLTARGQSLLCCTPHRVRIPLLEHLFRGIAEITTVDRMMSRGAAWTDAVRARTNPRIIIGTRAASWNAPPELGAIVLDGAESDDLAQWDAVPRYDARTIAQWTATSRRIPLILLSHTPRVVDWAHADHRVDLGATADTGPEIIDLHLHWRAGGRGSLSERAYECVDLALATDRTAVFLHNRRGLASRLTCSDCAATVSCATCGTALAEHPSGLQCHRCGAHLPTPTVCPSCRSPRLSGRGIGTAGIVRELTKRYPDATIASVDRDTAAPLPENAQIIVGSERFLHSFAPTFRRAVGALIMVDATRFVRSDAYQSNERLFQSLREAAVWARTWRAPYLVQTSATDLPALRALRGPLVEFYRSELAERAALRYPPATRIIQCTSRTPLDLSEMQTRATVEHIDGPNAARDRRGAIRHVTVLRLRGDANDDDVAEIVRDLPGDADVTVDPVELAV